MNGQFRLTDKQVERLKPHFPKPRGKPRVDDREVLSGVLHVLRNGLRRRDAPVVYGPHKTLYNRFVRWSRLTVFARIFRGLAQPGPDADTIMMDIEPVVRHRSEKRRRGHIKAHRTAASLRKRGTRPRAIGHKKGGLNSKLHMVSDGKGRPLTFFLSPVQMSDAKGAVLLLAALSRAKTLLGDKGHRAGVRHRSKGAGEGRLAAG